MVGYSLFLLISYASLVGVVARTRRTNHLNGARIIKIDNQGIKTKLPYIWTVTAVRRKLAGTLKLNQQSLDNHCSDCDKDISEAFVALRRARQRETGLAKAWTSNSSEQMMK